MDTDSVDIGAVDERTALLNDGVIIISETDKQPALQAGSTWYSSVFLVVNAALGAGLLNFPYAYHQSGGIFAAILIQAVLLIFIIGALVILAYCSDVEQTATYQDVVHSMCGKRMQILSAITLILYTFGTCITFFIIIGDQWDKFLSCAYGPEYCFKWYMNRQFTMISTSILFILPLCFPKRIDFLKYVSFLGVLGIIYCVLLVTVKYFVSDIQPGPVRTSPSHITDVFIVVPVICFGYQYHISVVPIYSCMKNRTLKDFLKTVLVATFICVLTYTVTASFGYLTFGSKVNEDILLSYEPTPDVLAAVILIAAKMYTTYPILLFVGRAGVDVLWVGACHLTPEQIALGEKRRRYIIAVIWFTTSLVLAVFLPNIGVVISILGELAALFIFIFPGLCLLQVLMKGYVNQISTPYKYKLLLCLAIGFLIIGSFIFGESMTQTMWNDISPENKNFIPAAPCP